MVQTPLLVSNEVIRGTSPLSSPSEIGRLIEVRQSERPRQHRPAKAAQSLAGLLALPAAAEQPRTRRPLDLQRKVPQLDPTIDFDFYFKSADQGHFGENLQNPGRPSITFKNSAIF
ncbi:hypothetical protein HT746_00870 [Burkholderia pyrrocinia]|uniref:hypothetical protein n=1 Tax=Burkholderia pyrrocinia TaxID=60550 RepID=UPI001574FE63|nr:hypothetical protein [Burkholderia pyrrocinia]NTX25716.1 hypothetical protein [Burkholderia pyrrocinia]